MAGSSPPSAVPRRRVTVVHAPACHFCEDAQDALAQLAHEVPLEVDVVDSDSPRGRQLLAAHRAGMFPLVLLDGAFFSAGRLPRRKLRAVLARDPDVTSDATSTSAVVR